MVFFECKVTLFVPFSIAADKRGFVNSPITENHRPSDRVTESAKRLENTSFETVSRSKIFSSVELCNGAQSCTKLV